MFFSRASIIVLVATVVSAAAIVERTDGTGPSNQCNVQQTAQCCNTVQDAKSATGILATVLALQGVIGNIGLECLPILSGGVCNANPVCCTGNTFNGLVNIGCNSF